MVCAKAFSWGVLIADHHGGHRRQRYGHKVADDLKVVADEDEVEATCDTSGLGWAWVLQDPACQALNEHRKKKEKKEKEQMKHVMHKSSMLLRHLTKSF